ncbi:zeta toxin family protein [bacterium]|nr:zeta toxin family protein [bacterium]
MNSESKHLIVVGGPNGSGKTSVAEFLLERGSFPYYFNADSIAKGLQHGQSGVGDLKAGRILLKSVQEAIRNDKNFGFETTLSGKVWRRTLEQAKQKNYEITLCYVAVKTVEDSIQRVSFRAREGGHNIPESDLRRRFPRSLAHFFSLYRNLADNWYFFDNTGTAARLIAHSDNGKEQILDEQLFRQYQEIGDTSDP